MDIKTILWPTDTSDAAAQALPYVTSLAEKYGATIVILNVQDEITRYERLAKSLNADEAARIREQFMSEAKQAMDALCNQLGNSCPLYKRVVVHGDPAEEILAFAEKEGVDIIVMATHGYGGLKRFAYGSVAEKVIHNSPVPVLTVRCK